jgi:hypothetical protein
MRDSKCWKTNTVNAIVGCQIWWYRETITSNYDKCLLLLTKYTDEQGSPACLLNEYWRKSFHSGLACASDGSDIVSPERGRLSEAGRSSHRNWLACASAGDLPCGSQVMRASTPVGCWAKLLQQRASQC